LSQDQAPSTEERLTQLTTSDPEFVEKYKVKIKAPGVSSVFPTINQGIIIHFIARVKDSGEEIENSYREKPRNFQNNNFKVLVCLQNVINRLCLGEKVTFECPIDECVYNLKSKDGRTVLAMQSGIPRYLPEEEELSFEVELQGISDMRTYKTLAFS